MSIYCVTQMSALHWVGGSKRTVHGGYVYEFLRPGDGGLRPNAYNEYVIPYNKMVLRETVSALLCLSKIISVLLNFEIKHKL